jgi:hypothetical protein
VAWQREDVAQRTSPTLAGFDLGLDGTLHLAWSEDAFPLFWEVASRRGGAWVVEDISALFGGARAADVTLAGDDAGFPHLVDASEGAATHVFRDAAGWRSEVLSVSLDVSNDRAAALVGGAGRLWLVLQTAVFSPSFHFDFSVIERGPTGWGAREPLGSGASVAAARSADGAALAVAAKAVSGPFSGALWIRRIGATAERTWFADATSSFAVGFRPDGKAWVLDRLRDPVSDDLTATQVVVLFEEL